MQNDKVLSYFRLIASEFADVTDEQVLEWAQIVTFYVDLDSYPKDKAEYIVALYIAHLLTLSSRAKSSAGYSGNLSREKEGDLERTFASIGVSGESLNSTQYGEMLKDLLINTGIGILTRYPHGGYC